MQDIVLGHATDVQLQNLTARPELWRWRIRSAGLQAREVQSPLIRLQAFPLPHAKAAMPLQVRSRRGAAPQRHLADEERDDDARHRHRDRRGHGPETQRAAILAGELDVGFSALPAPLSEPRLTSAPASSVSFLVALPAGHVLAGHKTLTAEQLSGVELVEYTIDDGRGDLVSDLSRLARLKLWPASSRFRADVCSRWSPPGWASRWSRPVCTAPPCPTWCTARSPNLASPPTSSCCTGPRKPPRPWPPS